MINFICTNMNRMSISAKLVSIWISSIADDYKVSKSTTLGEA